MYHIIHANFSILWKIIATAKSSRCTNIVRNMKMKFYKYFFTNFIRCTDEEKYTLQYKTYWKLYIYL